MLPAYIRETFQYNNATFSVNPATIRSAFLEAPSALYMHYTQLK